MPRSRVTWTGDAIKALRRHMGLTQAQFAEELGTRQQTISEWETGVYRPRGTAAKLLTILAERAAFDYTAVTGSEPERSETGPGPP